MITSDEPVKYTYNNNILEIMTESDNTFGYNNMNISGNSGTVAISHYGNAIASGPRGNTTAFSYYGDAIVNGDVVIKGIPVILKSSQEPQGQKLNFKIPEGQIIRLIKLTKYAKLYVDDNSLGQNIIISLSNYAKFNIIGQNNLISLKLKAENYAKFLANHNLTVTNALIIVNNYSQVSGFHVTEKIVVKANDYSSINCSASRSAEVDKTKQGYGNINIVRI